MEQTDAESQQVKEKGFCGNVPFLIHQFLVPLFGMLECRPSLCTYEPMRAKRPAAVRFQTVGSATVLRRSLAVRAGSEESDGVANRGKPRWSEAGRGYAVFPSWGKLKKLKKLLERYLGSSKRRRTSTERPKSPSTSVRDWTWPLHFLWP